MEFAKDSIEGSPSGGRSHDQESVLSLGFDVLVMHGLHLAAVLLDYQLAWQASVARVAFQSPRQTDCVVAFHKDAEAELRTYSGRAQRPETFEDEPPTARQRMRIASASVGEIVVARDVDTSTAQQTSECPMEERPFDGEGVIEIKSVGSLRRQVGAITVESVHLEDGGVRSQFDRQAMGEPALAGCAAAGNCDQEGSNSAAAFCHRHI